MAAERSPARTGRVRVLTLIANPTSAGGAERMAAATTMALDPARFERILCATRLPLSQQLDAELGAAGVRLLRLQRRTRADVAAWAPLVALLRRERVDVIHAHLFGSNVWAALLGRAAGVPAVIAHEHGQAYRRGPRSAVMRHLVARRADAVLCASSYDRARMIALQGVPAEKLRVLPNGIPPGPVAAAGPDAVRAGLGLPAGAPLIAVVANLRPEKAVDTAVAAFAHVRRTAPDALLIVAGDGPDRPRVEAEIARHGLGASVRLLGRRHDVPDLLAASDVALLSSDREGCPVSLLEYMAAGRAIVATAVGGVPDVIADGVHGLVVPARDAAAMGAAIVRLMRDPGLRRRLGEAARSRQQHEFTFAATMDRLQDLYECLARTARARG
jgi:glycosyltransferase involved in cell wall biosynthesis